MPIAATGCHLVGTEGSLLSSYKFTDQWQRIPAKAGEELTGGTDYMPMLTSDHFGEFVDAIRRNGTCLSNFPDVAGPFTETILLGNLALLHEGKVEWDAVNLRAKNAKGLDGDIRPTYREGYTL